MESADNLPNEEPSRSEEAPVTEARLRKRGSVTYTDAYIPEVDSDDDRGGSRSVKLFLPFPKSSS